MRAQRGKKRRFLFQSAWRMGSKVRFFFYLPNWTRESKYRLHADPFPACAYPNDGTTTCNMYVREIAFRSMNATFHWKFQRNNSNFWYFLLSIFTNRIELSSLLLYLYRIFLSSFPIRLSCFAIERNYWRSLFRVFNNEDIMLALFLVYNFSSDPDEKRTSIVSDSNHVGHHSRGFSVFPLFLIY